jgi:hypothetical protein
MKRDQAYIVTRIITEEDGSTGYPGGDVDWRVRDLCDLAPGDEIASIPGDMDHCYSVINILRTQQVIAHKRAIIEEMIDQEVCTDGELLAYEYAVCPDGDLRCKMDYSEEEWETIRETDVARFAPGSRLGRMKAFMCINAGISPM